MTLSESQVEQFKLHGWVAVPNFWNEQETAAMQAEVENLKSKNLLRNVATAGDGKTQSKSAANLQLCPMSTHSTLFRALPFAPKVIEAVGQLVGNPVVLQIDQVFLKPAKHGAGTNWHQDNAYFVIENPLRGTALWTAVHPATVENGTLRLIPDAYAEKLEHSRDGDSNHHIRCYPDEGRAVPVELPAGGAVFFAYGTPHATGGNTTDHDRAGAAFHFLNADAIPNGSFEASSSEQKHPVLSGPAASDGMAEYGQPVAGTWDQEVAARLS